MKLFINMYRDDKTLSFSSKVGHKLYKYIFIQRDEKIIDDNFTEGKSNHLFLILRKFTILKH